MVQIHTVPPMKQMFRSPYGEVMPMDYRKMMEGPNQMSEDPPSYGVWLTRDLYFIGTKEMIDAEVRRRTK